jgi:hypothetical protein
MPGPRLSARRNTSNCRRKPNVVAKNPETENPKPPPVGESGLFGTEVVYKRECEVKQFAASLLAAPGSSPSPSVPVAVATQS